MNALPVVFFIFACLFANCTPSGAAHGQSGAILPQVDVEVKPIGKVIATEGAVTIEHTSGVLLQANISASGATKVDDLVYRGDMIKTGADGKLSLAFADGTSFKVSSNARMELNEFVYDPKGIANKTFFNLAKGSFTFVAGAVAKTGDMRIDTPVATMGIRGTAPHVEIAEDGSVKFSTLIEENKSAKDAAKTPARSRVDHRQRAVLPTAPYSVERPKLNSEKLNICKGC